MNKYKGGNMQYIDEKFKDSSPEDTVKKIQTILKKLEIEVFESWNDSGIENCHSVNLSTKYSLPSYNGKGITKEFARASAYAEFIERLQSGLFTCKYQSIIRDPEMNFQNYAPDGKYMSVAELIENGEWMNYIVEEYKDPRITKESIAQNALAYACADDGKVLTVPFYSLFEDKYVYLPIAFVNRMYTANGNCAGNTREEAWVHALSEMMERNASRKMVMSGNSYPKISSDILAKFPVVSKILNKLNENGEYDVTVFDCSLGNGFPVIATRVINKRNQTYLVNVAADPILEIAIQRTLTELFQGRAISNLNTVHSCKILGKVTDYPLASNVLNHTHTSDGMYTVDFFANEMTCDKKATEFPDNSKMNNKELLTYMLDLYKKLGKPVYVRNYSFLGFHSYKFVVPGFSETRAVCLNEIIPEYALGDSVREVYKNITQASEVDLAFFLSYNEKISSIYGQYNFFSMNAGVPLVGNDNFKLSCLTRAYAAYKLQNFKQAIAFLKPCIDISDEETRQYFSCINMYLKLKTDGVEDEKIHLILYKFFKSKYPDMLYEKLNKSLTPYEDYILKCEINTCCDCKYKGICRYHEFKELIAKVGSEYNNFIDGQNVSDFIQGLR